MLDISISKFTCKYQYKSCLHSNFPPTANILEQCRRWLFLWTQMKGMQSIFSVYIFHWLGSFAVQYWLVCSLRNFAASRRPGIRPYLIGQRQTLILSQPSDSTVMRRAICDLHVEHCVPYIYRHSHALSGYKIMYTMSHKFLAKV